MRNYRLSQDALFVLSRRYRKKWGVSIRRFILFFAGLFLLVGCGTLTSPELTTSTWECISAPHIQIAFDSYDSQGYSYFRLVIRNETTQCRAATEDLYVMLADGCWEQTEIGEPLLLPPPAHWGDGISDRLEMGVRINGSALMPMQTLTPLPNDRQITIEKEKEK